MEADNGPIKIALAVRKFISIYFYLARNLTINFKMTLICIQYFLETCQRWVVTAGR